MATQWKRVYVPGKGYRWTDGKGNYKTSNPSYRNPASDVVNAGASAASSAGRAAASTASRSASATATAAGRTAERERSNSSNAIGYRARKEGEKRAAKPSPKPDPKPNWRSKTSSSDVPALRKAQSDAVRNHPANRSPATADAPPAPTTLPSPALSAPVRSKPQDFGSAYAPQAGQAPRPNTPQPTANPFSSVGDVRGQQLSPAAAGMPTAQPQVGNQEFQGQKLQGIDDNGIDMQRRRAFLDADNSLDGMKAVRELLNRRKLSIAVEN